MACKTNSQIYTILKKSKPSTSKYKLFRTVIISQLAVPTQRRQSLLVAISLSHRYHILYGYCLPKPNRTTNSFQFRTPNELHKLPLRRPSTVNTWRPYTKSEHSQIPFKVSWQTKVLQQSRAQQVRDWFRVESDFPAMIVISTMFSPSACRQGDR